MVLSNCGLVFSEITCTGRKKSSQLRESMALSLKYRLHACLLSSKETRRFSSTLAGEFNRTILILNFKSIRKLHIYIYDKRKFHNKSYKILVILSLIFIKKQVCFSISSNLQYVRSSPDNMGLV